MNPEDRRVKRTRKLLAEALVSLALEKGYEEITIQEITDRADIGYRTFFRHYQDKDDLLQDVLRTTMAEVHQLMRLPSPDKLADPSFHEAPLENGRILFQHVQDNADAYRVLLQSGPVGLEPVRAFACQEATGLFSAIPDSPIPPEIMANHVISANFSLIRWWLNNDMPYSPEKMGEYSAQLIMGPVRQILLN